MFFIKFVQFFFYVWIDIFKAIKNYDGSFQGFGVRMYVGLYGQGKTLAMVEYARRMKLKYKDNVNIFTNFTCSFADGFIDTWQDIIDAPECSIFLIDEVQNTFHSRQWDKFPKELISLLTQNRKVKKEVLFSAQRYTHVDKSIRDLCNDIIECRAFGKGRWVFQKWFDKEDYELGDMNDNKAKRHRKKRYNFIAHNEIRNAYNTHEIVKTLGSKDNIEKITKKNTNEDLIKNLLSNQSI